jgi:hypothetical protein
MLRNRVCGGNVLSVIVSAAQRFQLSIVSIVMFAHDMFACDTVESSRSNSSTDRFS